MTATTRRGRWAVAALGLAIAVAVGACGGDDDDTDAAPTTVGGPTTTSGPAGALPNLCDLVTDEEMEEATGKDVGTHYVAQNQCIYTAPDEKTLVGSVMAYRPGFVDFDDLVNTRGTRRTDDIDGARTVFHPDFAITAALKGDKFVSTQLTVLPGGDDDRSTEDIERITRELLEKAVARA